MTEQGRHVVGFLDFPLIAVPFGSLSFSGRFVDRRISLSGELSVLGRGSSWFYIATRLEDSSTIARLRRAAIVLARVCEGYNRDFRSAKFVLKPKKEKANGVRRAIEERLWSLRIKKILQLASEPCNQRSSGWNLYLRIAKSAIFKL